MKLLLLPVFFLLLNCTGGKPEEKKTSAVDSLALPADIDYMDVANYSYSGAIDTATAMVVDFDCAVLIYPTDAQVEAMQKEYGEEDFSTVADDAMFYQSMATEKLDSAGIKLVIITKKRYVKFQGASGEWTMDVRKKGFPEWNLILFSKDKAPKITYATDLTNENLESYYLK